MSAFRGIPPGPNVGTQLKALRRKRKQAQAAQPSEAEPQGPAQNAATVPAKPHEHAPAIQHLNIQQVEQWFARQGWAPFDFQREVWDAMVRGESGMLHATTGAGK
ncbi:MAG TPA: DNA ligase-associated DEXH box helicase, partial [Limnobacter sp.]|nr:DNA ligase-associated DEXH box helicase [Limnobacter sp.]